MHSSGRSTDLFIVGRGLVPVSFGGSNGESPQTSPSPADTERKFRFGIMFPQELYQFREKDREGLQQLGLMMEGGPQIEHPSLPAGFTYLAQFITHDISFNQNEQVPSGALTAREIIDGRTPSLDLDSLYGNGPGSSKPETLHYANDLIHLAIGPNNKDVAGITGDYDLPRFGDDDREHRSRARIPDKRNDDNLAVAQTTVAFIKFHNAVVDRLATQGLAGRELFDKAREKVVQHYQWIVLHDYLPKIVQPDIVDDVLKSPKFSLVSEEGDPFVPVEFAFAAFRYGHTMIRERYEWNRLHQGDRSAMLFNLFNNTGANGNMQNGMTDTLPSSWVIDWTRFYDFGTNFNKARKMCTSINSFFTGLPGFLSNVNDATFQSLAAMDLVRGWALGLPSGQAVARFLHETVLLGKDVADGPCATILREKHFDENTPLWYYILREAELINDGKFLGPVGSRIVSETIVGLVRASRTSILPEWEPDLPSREPKQFRMTDLLEFAGFVNPLGS